MLKFFVRIPIPILSFKYVRTIMVKLYCFIFNRTRCRSFFKAGGGQSGLHRYSWLINGKLLQYITRGILKARLSRSLWRVIAGGSMYSEWLNMLQNTTCLRWRANVLKLTTLNTRFAHVKLRLHAKDLRRCKLPWFWGA